MTTKTITVLDNGAEKTFVITKLFANQALQMANILTDVSPEDPDGIKQMKLFIDTIFQNGSIPSGLDAEVYNIDYMDALVQLLKKRMLKDDKFLEVFIKNSIWHNGELKLSNLSLFANPHEQNNINNILTSIPAQYAFYKEHLIFNYESFFLKPNA